MQLRDYQQQGVEQIRLAFRQGARRVLYQSPVGSGKTYLFSYICQQSVARGNTCVILVHRRELVRQTSESLAECGVPHGVIAPGWKPVAAAVQVASVQTLARRPLDRGPELIVEDECFPAGTLIDGRPIESLRVGHLVYSRCREGYLTIARVARITKSVPSTLCTLHLRSGASISCTWGHPFYVRCVGWVRAIDLREGMVLCIMDEPDMHAVPREVCLPDPNQMAVSHVAQDWPGLLHPDVPRYVGEPSIISANGPNEPTARERSDESPQSDESPGNSREGENEFASDGLETPSAWRQWDAAAVARATFGELPRLEPGSCSGDPESAGQRLSALLQDRHREFTAQSRHRSGRQQSLFSSASGSKEAGFSGVDWVDHIEIHKPGVGGTFRGLCPDGFVYNLEVEQTHNYFANGVLVHNCHHSTAGSWKRVHERWPQARILGVTATPARLDGRGLGEVFEVLINGPTVHDLTTDTYLAPVDIWAPPGINTEGVKIKRGDYDAHQLNERVAACRSITGDAIEHYRKHGGGHRFIAFTVSVQHAHDTAAQFRAACIPCVALEGEMTPTARDRALREYGQGIQRGVASCDLISEGLNVPAATVCISLRPTASLNVAVQQWGRVMRGIPGKRAILLDHVGNVLRHGAPDDPREWTLDGGSRGKKKPAVGLRVCRSCFAVSPARARVCVQCGEPFVVEGRKMQLVDGELQRLERGLFPPIAPTAVQLREEAAAAHSLAELMAIAKKYQYRPGWAYLQWQSKQRLRQRMTPQLTEATG